MEVGGGMPVVDDALAAAHASFEAGMVRLLAAGDRAEPAQAAALARFVTAGVNGLVTMAEAGASRPDLEAVAGEILDHVARRLADGAVSPA